jgi:hypothetical protein
VRLLTVEAAFKGILKAIIGSLLHHQVFCRRLTSSSSPCSIITTSAYTYKNNSLRMLYFMLLEKAACYETA